MAHHIAVLGAGLAGLSAAWSLATRGYTVTVFERDAVVGGLAKSVSHRGFTFDIGPHRFLAPQNSRVWQLVYHLLGNDLQLRQRKSHILTHGKYVAYPLQAKSLFANTAFADNLAAIGSFLWSRVRWHLMHPPDTHFEQWMLNRFGRVLYHAHFQNYTHKLWGLLPEEISADWAAERISQLTLWDMLRHLVLPAREAPRTQATAFYYPLGGIGTIADRLAHRIQQHGGTIALRTTVAGLKTQAERVVAVRWTDQSSGDAGCTEVDGVISTIPLPVLARMCPHGDGLEPAIGRLRYRSLVLVHVLLKRDWITGDHWLYVPEDRYPFNRISEPKSFSAYLSPPEHTSLCAEITCDAGDALWHADPDSLIERVVDSLAGLGLFHKTEVCGGFVTREAHEYPIYTLGYRTDRTAVLTHLRRFTNLHTTGRQGLFQYCNMDHAVEMGLTAADTLYADCTLPLWTTAQQEE
jgi:protoporphyrinogen oxidase